MAVVAGAVRYNRDSNKLELYDGNQWLELVASSPDTQTGGARGAFGGGILYPATYYNVIDYITISTTGNALDFGDLSLAATWYAGSLGSRTRGIWAGVETPGSPYAADNRIDYVTITSTGNSQDFGDLVVALSSAVTSGAASATRGLIAGGAGGGGNTIQYITMASTGNSVDFGDLVVARYAFSALASSTRGVFGGSSSPAYLNSIDYVTISTLGNAADFGDLTNTSGNGSGCSNATRGLFTIGIGGPAPVARINSIEFITIASTGNSVDFGDTTTGRFYGSSVASSIRGVHAGGAQSPTVDYNIIDYVNIMTIGNALDFGDLTTARRGLGGVSNAHGGL